MEWECNNRKLTFCINQVIKIMKIPNVNENHKQNEFQQKRRYDKEVPGPIKTSWLNWLSFQKLFLTK